MRAMSKQITRKTSLTGRLLVYNTPLITRRTIDVFIIEARNLAGAAGSNKTFNPYVRLKLGTNKKFRTQVLYSKSSIDLFCLL